MRLISYFLPSAPVRLVYMLQQVEYDSFKFVDWVDNLPHLGKVQIRQQLDLTARAKLTVLIAYLLWGIPLVAGLGYFAFSNKVLWLLLAVFAPLFCVVGLFIFNGFFGRLIVMPTEQKTIAKATKKLSSINPVRIAVLGSYGKTSMKDLLQIILSEGKKVSATPGNKNVLISHARWVLNVVEGNEDILIFEYGEAEPGDIKTFTSFCMPSMAVIAGLAPAHMDGYGTLEAIAKDFSDIYSSVDKENVFINDDSPELVKRLTNGIGYNSQKVDGWKISSIVSSIDGLAFTMQKSKHTLKLTSQLLGKHNIGPLSVAVAIASRLGLTDNQIAAGVAKTKPYEHRMQPYNLGGASIIDDTYNGNFEGMKAGLELLKTLPAKRKIYITPGLVEQGNETQVIHQQLGEAIAKANPDKIVLMKNSVTDFITNGLKTGNFQGDVAIETDPLEFYTNLQHIVASGDVVLMQNDWTDNYS